MLNIDATFFFSVTDKKAPNEVVSFPRARNDICIDRCIS